MHVRPTARRRRVRPWARSPGARGSEALPAGPGSASMPGRAGTSRLARSDALSRASSCRRRRKSLRRREIGFRLVGSSGRRACTFAAVHLHGRCGFLCALANGQLHQVPQSSTCRCGAFRDGDGTTRSAVRSELSSQTTAERLAVGLPGCAEVPGHQPQALEPSSPRISPVHRPLARTPRVQFQGASAVAVCGPSARASGPMWPRRRQRWRGPALWSHASRRTALVASTAPALATASTAPTAGALPTVGGGCWAGTAARRLGEVAEPGSAPVPGDWLPQSRPGSRSKAPVAPWPTDQTGTVWRPVGGRRAAGKSVAG